MPLRRVGLLSAALAVGLAGCAAVAEPCGDVRPGERRAGYPSRAACWAQPSDPGCPWGYLVGGGSPCHGDPPGPEEGTWGWDAQGLLGFAHCALLWLHGQREQGGTGAYKPDGPRLLEAHRGE
jgi:hypothetical protein